MFLLLTMAAAHIKGGTNKLIIYTWILLEGSPSLTSENQNVMRSCGKRNNNFVSCPPLTLAWDSSWLPETEDVVEKGWRWKRSCPLTHHPACGGQRVYRGKFETKLHRTAYTKTSMRGRELEGLLFGSCKFIPVICLQLRPVCTVCLQSGAINIIVRGCSWLKCLSYFSLPGFKWALTGFLPQCFSFQNVNASLDLYQPLYTLPFISFSLFPGSATNNKRLRFTVRRQHRSVSAVLFIKRENLFLSTAM